MDYREPLAAVLRGHLGLSEEAAARVFPGFAPKEPPEAFLTAPSGDAG
jgi:hypothetical protein